MESQPGTCSANPILSLLFCMPMGCGGHQKLRTTRWVTNGLGGALKEQVVCCTVKLVVTKVGETKVEDVTRNSTQEFGIA